jgi:SRSO17 transposase
MCPLCITGLIGPGERKSVQPMAARLASGEYDQLHHFVASGVWGAASLEAERLIQADRLVGGQDAMLVLDDTALPDKGSHSVGVAAQYASVLGKTATCQTLVSTTLARAGDGGAAVRRTSEFKTFARGFRETRAPLAYQQFMQSWRGPCLVLAVWPFVTQTKV